MILPDLEKLWVEAKAYLNSYQSIQQFEERERYLLNDIRHNFFRYAECIVALHINPRLSEMDLSTVSGLFMNPSKMEIIAGFYIREELTDGNDEILSGRQFTRRRHHECFFYSPDVDYKNVRIGTPEAQERDRSIWDRCTSCNSRHRRTDLEDGICGECRI